MYNPHDTGMAVFNEEGELEFYCQLERLTRKKHDDRHLSLLLEEFPSAPRPQAGDIVGYGTSASRKPNRPASVGAIGCLDFDWDWMSGSFEHRGVTMLCIDHHIAHACAAWCFRTDDSERTFLSYDGGGLDEHRVYHHSTKGIISADKLEVTAVDTIPSSNPLGRPFGIFNVGKLMGLAGSRPNAKIFSDPDNLLELIGQGKRFTDHQLDLCAGYYRYHIEKIWEAVEQELVASQGVVIAGGATLALEINSRIHRKTLGDVVFGPSTDDSGIALGNAAYAYFKTTGQWPKRLLSASINRSMRTHTPSSSLKQIAKLLSEGTICGIVRNDSEAGPRALGYRSLLASAETTEMKTLVSERIKGRESYRPLAPIVTDKEFDRLFVGPRGKFMQYSVNCTDECKEIVPAIVHTDNTSRPQVVDASDPWLYDLLIEYGKLTGTECLINTSLNTDGRPIANDLVDAQYDFRQYPVQIFGV